MIHKYFFLRHNASSWCTRHLLFATIFILPVGTVAAQDSADIAYSEANDLILDENWTAAIDALSTFRSDYRNSSRQDDAAFFVCYATDKKGGALEDAFSCFEDFTEDFSDSNYVDDAKSSMVRIARSLARQGKPEYEQRIQILRQEENAEVAVAALYALRNMGDEEALATILDLYDRTENENIREKIVYILGDFDSAVALDRLLTIPLSDASMGVRKSAVYALSNYDNDERVVDGLVSILSSDTDEEVRVAALHALGNTDSPNAIVILGEVARTSSNVDLAKAATYALGNQDDRIATRELGRVLREAKSMEVRKAALFAFGNRDDPESLPFLVEIAC